MNITEKDVQLLELAYYFINNCHYKFVSSRSAQNEIWLGNPQHPQYPVIRLSQTRLSTVFFDKQRILQIHQAIRNLFRRNCDLLDIHLSDEAVEEKEEQMAIVTITPQSISCPSLLALFPGMDQAVHPIEDPHQEYRRISDKLEELQRQKKREVRKIRQSMQPKATLVLMAICTAVYLLSLFLTWRYRSWAGAGEVNTAVGIFLGAWRALGDRKYLEWAEKTLDSVLDFHQREDGRIETYTAWLGKYEDYSTVCSPMINIVDMYRAECGRDEEKSARYAASAKRLAEYLCKRGLSFPTEGGADERAEAEMEDGSISCTALSLLYYDRYVEKSPRFVEKARGILDWHESWVVNTPLCCMQGSSLRWWETNWEGDKDGPALCMGHAWTIWRAEADLLMYEATGEREYLRKAECGFNTNFAKIHADGRSYTVFQIDYITGWRYFRAEEVRYELAKEFPEQFDNGTSGYVWTRAADAFLDRKEKTL